MNIEADKKTVIKSLTGIKVFALLLIFYSHSRLPVPDLGLGSRMCELLFVMSGFLVGYNKIDKSIPCTYKAGFSYFISKFVLFFPLHLIITLLRAIIQYDIFNDISNWIIVFLSIFLLTPWSPFESTFFCFNGSSWFLSALLFCYFLTPLFLRLTKYEKPLFFILVFFIRLFIYLVTKYTGIEIITIHTHVNPFVRSLEFFLGMLLVPYFKNLKEYIISNMSAKRKYIVFSILEIFIFVTT